MKRNLPPTTSWAVPAGEPPVRLDLFVRRCLPQLSLREARRAIDEKLFWLHDRPGRKGDKLFGGDVVSYRGDAHLLASSPPPGRDLQVPVLYEDESVLALDKPAGMATHGFSGRERSSLANFLTATRPYLCRVGRSRWEPGLVHRLDRDTSGVVLVAKDQNSFEGLRSQFRLGLIRKKYRALVWGRLTGESIVDFPLARDPRNRKKMTAVREKRKRSARAGEWPALTRIKALRSSRGFTLLEVEIDTGVTHQIRAHLEASGYPLVGDPLYGGGRPDWFGLGRQFLHACYLGFRHPKSGQEVVIESPLPRELTRVLEDLGIKQ